MGFLGEIAWLISKAGPYQMGEVTWAHESSGPQVPNVLLQALVDPGTIGSGSGAVRDSPVNLSLKVGM
jgi:hypothetical protein